MMSREGDSPFRELVEKLNQGILVRRSDKLLFANQALATILGYDGPDDVLSLGSPEAWLPPDALALVKQRADARLRGDRQPDHYDHPAVRADGTTIWLRTHTSVIDWEGEAAILTAFDDVTKSHEDAGALQASERRFRSVIEDALAGIVVRQGDKCVFANQAYADLFGYKDPSEIRA
ncbi:MAG: PAS domain S-box protein, partial [Alphaproteobacteria bacterium]|nr:PAS domain S-box protein [Alphaproteobacteria bacterium]